jgi:hypothetical protein
MAGTLNTTTVQTLQTTQGVYRQLGKSLTTYANNSTLSSGDIIQNVTLNAFLKPVTIKFHGVGLKPNTKVYAYFNNVPVTKWTAPVASTYDNTTIAGQQDAPAFGTQDLVTDSTGSIWGIFRIPSNTFRAEQCDFLLTDIADLSQGQAARTTQATGVFYGSRLAATTTNYKINTRDVVLGSKDEASDPQTIYGLQLKEDVTRTYIPDPPPSRGGGGCGCGSVICTQLYMLGLMDFNTYQADTVFGAKVLEKDPELYYGYRRWAATVLDFINGGSLNFMPWIKDDAKRIEKQKDWALRWTYVIAKPWSEHMAYTVGMREKDNKLGKWFMKIGTPITKFFNRLPELEPNIVTLYAMIGMFSLFYVASRIAGTETLESKLVPAAV